MALRAGYLAALAVVACTPTKASFVCTSSDQCTGGELVQTYCERNGSCSFQAPDCSPYGRRYFNYAGDGLSEKCVGAEIALPVAHVPPGASLPSSGSLVLAVSSTIDTDALSISDAGLPEGVTFDRSAQLDGGPELAVLHVHQLSIEDGAHVRVIGSRPLVVIAGDTVVLKDNAVLDASGHRDVPGCGGSASGTGPGRGFSGGAAMDNAGGGGAGHAAPGGRGGDTNGLDGGAGGIGYGDGAVSTLEGGSGGGLGGIGQCSVSLQHGGGGGGAIQLYSAVRISLGNLSTITVSGGGGQGGYLGGDCQTWGAGSGGGSGGTIVLQGPQIDLGGHLAANGGGGGGGACDGTNASCAGHDGEDGRSDSQIASGGDPGTGNPCGAAGGAGGSLDSDASPAMKTGCLSGGGGGATGRIALITETQPTLSGISPAPHVALTGP